MLTQKEDLTNVEMHSAHFIPQHKEKLFSDEMSSLLWHGKVLPFFPWNLQISFHQLSNLHYVLLWMKHSSLVMVWHQVHSDFSLSVRTLRPQKDAQRLENKLWVMRWLSSCFVTSWLLIYAASNWSSLRFDVWNLSLRAIDCNFKKIWWFVHVFFLLLLLASSCRSFHRNLICSI